MVMIWKAIIGNFGKNGLNEKRMGLEKKNVQQKILFSLTPRNISTFFGNYVPYNKNDPHQIQFEEDLGLMIAKELFPFSFVKEPYFRILILK